MALRDLDAPGFKPLDRAAADSHDRHFAEDFLAVKGAPRPMSRTLARQLGYSLLQSPRWHAGSDAEDGEVHSEDDGPGMQGAS